MLCIRSLGYKSHMTPLLGTSSVERLQVVRSLHLPDIVITTRVNMLRTAGAPPSCVHGRSQWDKLDYAHTLSICIH